MTQFNAPSYDIERPTGRCALTGRPLNPGEAYIAALIEVDPAAAAPTPDSAAGNTAATGSAGAGAPGATGSPGSPTKPASAAAVLGFKRLDISLDAWQQGTRPEHIFSFWRSTVPEPNAKKRLFVDDEVLLNLFRRLADTDQPQRLAFRFVLALILMRKKLLRYEGSTMKPTDGGNQEWWRMVPKGEIEPLEVLDPHLDEPQIQQVTEQLGEILEAEL